MSTAKAPIPELAVGEWADAVARFRHAVRGDVPRMDAEFLQLHNRGGAQVVYHERELVGVFYPSPGWDHSEGAVRVFSELARLRAQGGWDER